MRPRAPVVAVGGVTVRDGHVLLIRRGQPPRRGGWQIPGGKVELGETLREALVREMSEETALVVEPLEILTVADRIERDDDSVSYHFVIVDYLCRWVAGEARAGSDALEVAWVTGDDLAAYRLPAPALDVVQDALRRSWPGEQRRPRRRTGRAR